MANPRIRRIVGAALLLVGAAVTAVSLVPEAPVSVSADDARPSPDVRVALGGGAWDCEALVPRTAALTVDDVTWVPYRGRERTVLVARTGALDCGALPASPVGVLTHMSESAYESLREHDPARWATVPQAQLSLLFSKPARRSRIPQLAGLIIIAAGLGLTFRRG